MEYMGKTGGTEFRGNLHHALLASWKICIMQNWQSAKAMIMAHCFISGMQKNASGKSRNDHVQSNLFQELCEKKR